MDERRILSESDAERCDGRSDDERQTSSERGRFTPTHLDLFSGIGGFALAAQWAGFRTIGFCEIDKYCQKVLAKNFGCVLADSSSEQRRRRTEKRRVSEIATAGSSAEVAKNFLADAATSRCNGEEREHGSGQPLLSARLSERGRAPIIPDIRDLDGRDFAGVSIITGGFPCQPFSCAGKRRGKEDDRHLWPEMLRVIKEARPAWVLGENVAGIINMELDSVLSDLESIGYATRTFAIPACAVDAKHRRMRVWIVANDTRVQSGRKEQWSEWERIGASSERIITSDDQGERVEGNGTNGQQISSAHEGQELPLCSSGCRWIPEPSVGRVAHGIPSRLDRLKGLGNAIVPQVAYQILKEIRKLI